MNLLEDLLDLAEGHDIDWFAKQHPGPYLLRQRTPEEQRSGLSRPVSGLTSMGMPVVKLESPPKPQIEEPFGADDLTQPYGLSPSVATPTPPEQNRTQRFVCHPVVKSNRNVFANGITIGRTPNNDVIVPLASISKFHAWIRGEGQTFLVYDARSRFGTFVDGVAASPNGDQGLLLRVGAELRLGRAP